MVVRTGLPRITPISRISRATLQRAIGKPSRIISDLADTVDREVLGEYARDFGLEDRILPRSCR